MKDKRHHDQVEIGGRQDAIGAPDVKLLKIYGAGFLPLTNQQGGYQVSGNDKKYPHAVVGISIRPPTASDRKTRSKGEVTEQHE